jgi:hypothetical protein
MQNKNFNIDKQLNGQLIAHLNHLQNKYSKILPIRADIHYAKDDELSTDIETTKNEITFFLWQAMQFELDIVGYAVVMEFNQNEHIHFHSIFYVNGQKRQKYYPIYAVLERLWHELTNGYLYDCQRNNYRINGLKMINHYDHEAFCSTCYMLSYLAKTEQKEPFKRRYSDCLFLSEVLPPSHRGKPRTLGVSKFLIPSSI